jgi:formate hydrogenlyase subunit 4
MAIDGKSAQARPLFRMLALGMAVVLFLLAAVFGLAPVADLDSKQKLVVVVPCLFVGYVMLTIGKTGFWPPRALR